MIDVFDLAEHESLNGGERAESAARLHRMCADTGFLVLDGHGVADATIGDIEGALAEFFAQPDEAKGRLAPAPGDPYGWIGVGRESLAQSRGEAAPPDLKETFNGGPLVVPDGAGLDALAFCYRPTPWPDVPGFRQAWSNYYRTMEQLAARLMSAMAEALGLSPDSLRSGAATSDLGAPCDPVSTDRGSSARRSTPGGRAQRLRLAHDPPARRGGSRSGDSLRSGLDRGRRSARDVRRQPRRPDGALDRRPLGLDDASRGVPA